MAWFDRINRIQYSWYFIVCQSNMANMTLTHSFITLMLFNMAAVSMFWQSKMAVMTSGHNFTILFCQSNMAAVTFIQKFFILLLFNMAAFHCYANPTLQLIMSRHNLVIILFNIAVQYGRPFHHECQIIKCDWVNFCK